MILRVSPNPAVQGNPTGAGEFDYAEYRAQLRAIHVEEI